MSTDRMARVAKVLDRDNGNLFNEEFLAESAIDAYATLTDAEWEQAREDAAEIVFTRALYMGKEGLVVTGEDKDSEQFWHCQDAAENIMRALGFKREGE